MAFALPAAATAVAAAAPAAVAKATIMATLKSVAFKAITNLAISAAMSALQPQVGGQSGRTFEFVIDPDGPIPFAAGRVGVAGSVIHRDTFGPDLMYYGMPFVLSGAGPITAIESFMADDYPMSFDANGGATTEPYRQELFFRSVLGHQPASAALTTPSGLKNGATLPGWTASHKLSGKAAGLIVMAENSKGSAFPTGEIKPLIQLLGLKGWDPTLDSTYPGGSGPCRLHDPSTWVTLTCPILWALKWSLGLWEGPNGKGAPQVDHQVGGIGAKLSGIDVPAFVAASNIAKANGWTVSAYPNTDDDKHQVLEAFLQAGGAIYSQRAGKISCISRAAPRTSIVTISAADTAGPLEIDTAASRIDRINTIRPRFWSPAHRWQMTAMEEVTAASYQTEDGGKRTRGIDYPFVSDARQAGQLAALQIANTREGIAGVIPLKPHLQRIRPGDAFTITEAGFVLNGLKCLCLNTDYDPATGVVRVSFVSETDAKYPFALGQNPTPPTPQVLTPVDPRFVSPPDAGDWTITPRPPSQGGTQQPGFDLTGFVSNSTATAIIVETGPGATGPWKQAYQGPPTVTNIPIDGLQPGATYFIAIQYQRNQNYSEREVFGPFTAPDLVAGDVLPSAPGLSQIKSDIEAAFGDIFDVSELLANARAQIEANAEAITGQAEDISGIIARADLTAADIIDLENALATETGARAQAIQQVTARQAIRPNLVVNSTAAQGMQGLTNFGSRTVVAYPTAPDGPQWAADAGGGSGLSFGARWASRPAKAGFPYSLQAELGGFGMTNGQVRAVGVFRNAGGGVTGYIVATAFYDAFAGGYVLRKTENVLAPAETVSYDLQIDVDDGAFTSGGSVGWKRVKLEQGPICTLWSDDASSVDLSASVTQHSLAIIDLELQQNIALWRIKAEASGSRPAIIEAYSGLGVSALAFSAEQLYLGDNTVFDDATNTWQTIDGSTVYIRAEGAPFGAFSNLREWWGPTGIALGAMTPDNGYSGRMTTAPYNFTNTLNPRTFSAYASPGSIEAHRSNAGSLTSAAVSILYQNAKGAVSVTWARLIGGVTAAGSAVIDAPNELTTTFTKTVSAQERTDTVFQATLTDAGSGERRQVIVPVVFTSGAA